MGCMVTLAGDNTGLIEDFSENLVSEHVSQFLLILQEGQLHFTGLVNCFCMG